VDNSWLVALLRTLPSDGVLSRSLPSGQGPFHGWIFARRNALAGASRHSNRLNHLRTNWILKPLTMIRIPFVYHREDLLEIQFFKTTSEVQGSRVFGSREQTIRPPAVEKEFAVGFQASPNIKLLDYGGRRGTTVCESPATLMPGQQISRTTRAKASLWNILPCSRGRRGARFGGGRKRKCRRAGKG
jgi:hypothetical protein